jgi:malonyl-CoA O-methyltransferase
MLWANLVVHGVIDPQALFARWHAALRTDGFLMFSALGPDTMREWRDWAQRVGGPPPTLDFIDMHDLGDMLVQAGFADPVMDMERITLTWADAQAMLSDLRACGVNAHPGRFQGLRTPRWRDRLIADLSHQLRAPDGRLHLSFEVIYGHAIKPLPRVKMAAQTAVSLEAMRQMVKAKPHQSPDIRD